MPDLSANHALTSVISFKYQSEANSVIIIGVKPGKPPGYMTTLPVWKAAPPPLTT